ncbi:amidohydrolase family protein [Nonomuraea thailandensis]
MIDGLPLIDAHVHVPLLGTLKPAWLSWARGFGQDGLLEDVWDSGGRPRPSRLDELFAAQGVDVALLFCEYSPKATGTQAFEDLLPIVEHNPSRFRPVANVNPHLHFPIAAEVRRQLGLGAAALKLHPVHGGFRCDDAALYPAYHVLEERGVPLVVHCGTSSFPGSANENADPAFLIPVIRDFPGSTSCSPTAGAAGGTTPPPSWPCPRTPSGWSCPACRPNGCPSTTPATTSPASPASGSSAPTGLAFPASPPTPAPSPGCCRRRWPRPFWGQRHEGLRRPARAGVTDGRRRNGRAPARPSRRRSAAGDDRSRAGPGRCDARSPARDGASALHRRFSGASSVLRQRSIALHQRFIRAKTPQPRYSRVKRA